MRCEQHYRFTSRTSEDARAKRNIPVDREWSVLLGGQTLGHVCVLQLDHLEIHARSHSQPAPGLAIDLRKRGPQIEVPLRERPQRGAQRFKIQCSRDCPRDSFIVRTRDGGETLEIPEASLRV